MMPRPTKEETGLEVALAWSRRATCPRRHVGCLLVDSSNRTLSTGYNGPPSGSPHCTEHPCPGAGLPSGSGLSLCEAIHAEANALLYCPDVRLIDTCYCTTAPCLDCVKLLLGTGCRRIVFAQPYVHSEAEWRWQAAGRFWVHVPPVSMDLYA